MTTTPHCFDSHEQFMEWRRTNMGTKEKATVCEDCTPRHMHAMQAQGKCDQALWSRVVLGPYMQFRIQEKSQCAPL